MKAKILSMIGVMFLFSANQVKAVEPLSTIELSSHCAHYNKSKNSKDAIFCVRYIQGFIDGAITTDERVVSNLSKEKDHEESFSERAIRTRLGNLKRYGSTYYADFCLGETPLREVVKQVIDGLENTKNSRQDLARNAVFKTLRKVYPCWKRK